MPIILDGSQTSAKQVQALKGATPQFFSKSLTGNGRSTRGLLNQNLFPARDAASAMISPQTCRDMKSAQVSGTSDFEFIPMMLCDFGSKRINLPALPQNAVCVSPQHIPEGERRFLDVYMHDVVIITTDKLSVKKRDVCCMYEIWSIKEQKDNQGNICYNADIYTEPALSTTQFALSAADTDLIEQYFGSLTVYDIIAATAERWNTEVPAMLELLIDNGCVDEDVTRFCTRLNNYPINLADYQTIYSLIDTKQKSALDDACEANLNILLNAMLKDLENNKPQIPTFTPIQYAPGTLKLSNEQIKAVTTVEPCCIVQAGAGTGKSTVIHHRLNYLSASGVDLKNVMVLSFTNAAADHIKEIAPDVNSKTIASMIHDIYSMNFNHYLSTTDTLLNILQADKVIPNTRVGLSLINGLRTIKSNKTDSLNTGLMYLSKLIHKHYDEVIKILDKVNQTTLELESLICYHAANLGANLQEPNALCTHLIMDEVQDNSIFEFIYVINYVVKHNACIYLVGDCAQTLYEFRASNPKALNCLEMSGVFECMQLQTNYRSNQNVLDFANLTLATIEANQFAQIQLRANQFQKNQFSDDVQVKYRQLNGIKGLYDALPSMIRGIKPWIDDKLAKQEQIAFLSYKRKDIDQFEKLMDIMYPDVERINIVPNRLYPNSFFSKYILYFGDDYVHKVGYSATSEITRHMIDNIDRLCKYDQQKQTIKDLLIEWTKLNQDAIAIQDAKLAAKQITMDDFIAFVFDTLVEFEIEKNAMKQRIVSAANEQMKEADISAFPIVASTIHSAKGLEFDNVILLYNEAKATEEEQKRMYYVGLTRAKKAEFVIAYGIKVNSNIESTYELVCESKGCVSAPSVLIQQVGDPNATATIKDRSVPSDDAIIPNDGNGVLLPVGASSEEDSDEEDPDDNI